MFRRKKNSTDKMLRLTLLPQEGPTLFEGAVSDYELPEETVLKLSFEYFSDPEPCEIHRAAVHKRAFMELIEFCPKDEYISIQALPDGMRRYFPAEAARLRLTEV